MPSVKTRPKARKKAAEDPAEREFRRLVLALGDVDAFRLYLATFDDPAQRDALIERASEALAEQMICITRLELEACDREASLITLLRQHLEAHPATVGERRAVMVTGLEALLEYGRSEDLRFLATANIQRDLLPDAVPVPVVLWLTPMAASALPKAAPDLWHWRSDAFNFLSVGPSRTDTLRSLVRIAPERELGLSGERRAERVELLKELIDGLERAGPPASRRELVERLDLQNQIACTLLDLGRAREAIRWFERMLELATTEGERHAQGVALGNLGIALADLGEHSKAIEFYEQHLEIAREIGDRRGEGNALGNLGNAWKNLGEPSKAIGFFEQQLDIVRETGDRRGEGSALGNLGNVWADLGEPSKAIGFHVQYIATAREIGDRRGESTALGNLGNAWTSLGEAGKAIEFYEKQFEIAREVGDLRGGGNALFNSALVYDALGERRRAVSLMRDALKIYEQIEDPWAEKARAKLAAWGAEPSPETTMPGASPGTKRTKA